jgi:integrase
MKLTAKAIAGLQLPAGKSDHLAWDDEIPGLGVRLRAGGSRSWVFQYAIGSRHRRMSLGAATAESVKTVREQAAQIHAKVKLGHDPAGEKTEARQRAGDTFEVLSKQYLVAKKSALRPRSYVQVELHIKHARPLNSLPVANITRRDIATLIGALKVDSGPVSANRVRSTLSDFFGWLMSEGIDSIEQNPVLNTNKSEETARDRVLNDHELRTIWKHLGDDHYGDVVRLLMLTGQRADEIASLQWSEISDAAINLPGSRTKNKRAHIIPLSDAAASILEKQPRRVNDDGSSREFVFGIREKGFSGWSYCKEALDKRIAAELGEPLPHWTVHDIRRSVATIMNDQLGVLPHVVEAILNHVSGHKGGVAGIYNRAQYMRERTEALQLWADHLRSIIDGNNNNVTPLRRLA